MQSRNINLYALGLGLQIIALLLVTSSAIFEMDFLGLAPLFLSSLTLALVVDKYKNYYGQYFLASSTMSLTGIILVYLFWILPSGFDYYSVNEGFDPARFDYLSRNTNEWNTSELITSNLLLIPTHILYGIFGNNIFTNGLWLNTLLSLILLNTDRDKVFAVALPVSLTIFPDLLLLYNLPAKEGYTLLAIFSFVILMQKSKETRFFGKSILFMIFILCCIPRPQIIPVLCVAYVAYAISSQRNLKIIYLISTITILASIFYLFQSERLDTISEYSAITRAGDNTESIDSTKGAVRDLLATDPRSFLHLILFPFRFIAYIIGPFPAGGLAQVSSFDYTIGPDGYAPYFALLNRFSFYLIISISIALIVNKAHVSSRALLMLSIFLAGIVFTSLYSPFLHIRYRIPFLPLLYLSAKLSNISFNHYIIRTILSSEVLSAMLYFYQISNN